MSSEVWVHKSAYLIDCSTCKHAVSKPHPQHTQTHSMPHPLPSLGKYHYLSTQNVPHNSPLPQWFKNRNEAMTLLNLKLLSGNSWPMELSKTKSPYQGLPIWPQFMSLFPSGGDSHPLLQTHWPITLPWTEQACAFLRAFVCVLSTWKAFTWFSKCKLLICQTLALVSPQVVLP